MIKCKRFHIFIYLLIFNTCSGSLAAEVSHLVESSRLDTLFQSNGKMDPKPVLHYWHNQLTSAGKGQQNLRMLRCNNMLGLGYVFDSNYEMAIKHCFDALKISNEFDSVYIAGLPVNQQGIYYQYQADTWYLLAELYLKVEEITKAKDHLTKALNLYQSIDCKEGMGKTTNRLGIILVGEKKIEEAITIFNSLLTFYTEINDTLGMANSWSNLGLCHTNQAQWKEADTCYRHALKLYQEIGNKEFEATAWFNLAAVLRNIENKESILSLYQKAELCCKDAGFMQGLIRVNIDIAQYYYEKHNLSRSEKYLTLALRYADSLNQKDFQMKIHQYFSDLYTEKGNFRDALESYKKSMAIYHSRFLSDKDKLSEMQLRYEIERREKENDLLQVQNRFQEYVLQTQINRRNFLIAFSFLLMIFLIVLVGRYRFRVKTNKVLNSQKLLLEEANRTKDKFMSIIAHDLRNPMMALISLSDALAENNERFSDNQRSQVIGSLQKSSHYLHDLLENLLMWAQTQSDRIRFYPECVNLKQAVEKAISQHNQLANLKNVTVENRVGELVSVFADANMLFFILRNLTSNAIKFSDPGGFVQLTAEEMPDFVVVQVKDNGCGMSLDDLTKLFDVNEVKNIGNGKNKGIGLGLALCNDFVKKHGGKINVSSELGKGTVIRFTINNCGQ